MGKKTDNLKNSLKMTNWEKNVQDISGFSAMPFLNVSSALAIACFKW